IGAHHAVTSSDFVPKLRISTSRRTDARYIRRQPVSVKGVEFVREPSDPKCRRPIGREDTSCGKPSAPGLANRVSESVNEFGMEATDRDLGALKGHRP